MADLKLIKTSTLRDLVEETEHRLDELREELERREDTERHHEIDRLDEHMKHAELSLTSIRDFISEMLADMRNKKAS